jgi:hypothetical protein
MNLKRIALSSLRRVNRGVSALTLSVAIAFSALPSQANAACCTVAAFATLVQSYVAQAEATILLAIEETQFVLYTAIQDAAAAIVAATEKQTAAQKEQTQAQLNYEAATSAYDRKVEAYKEFTSPAASPYARCETAATSEAVANAALSARLDGKATASVLDKRSLYTESSSREFRAMMEDHNNNYCTQQDAERGRCTAVPEHRRGANLSAGTLLAPNGGQTYTPEEAAASYSFMKWVTDPVPTEMLPRGLEKTPSGQRFVAEQMAANAQMSVARHALTRIWASKKADARYGQTAAGQASSAISLSGLMEKFVTDRFGNKDYNTQLQAMNENGLLREIAINLAGQNWMDYHAFQQQESIETMLAVQLAILSKERAERQLAIARNAAATPRK